MQSIFEDELLMQFRPQRRFMPLLAPAAAGQGALLTVDQDLTRATYRIDDKRKRTVKEALIRIYEAKPPNFEKHGLYGLHRLTRKPFGIYNVARLLAAGLVIIDPMDRLDGGLID